VGNEAISGITPTTVNSSVRTREYLTEAEIERLGSVQRVVEGLEPSRWGDDVEIPAGDRAEAPPGARRPRAL
jgi:hypothetical protein